MSKPVYKLGIIFDKYDCYCDCDIKEGFYVGRMGSISRDVPEKHFLVGSSETIEEYEKYMLDKEYVNNRIKLTK